MPKNQFKGCCWRTLHHEFRARQTTCGHACRQLADEALLRFASSICKAGTYTPYHSKYNPVERCWGILETHWNGALLDSLEAVCGFTASMPWKGLHPVVDLVTTTYATGVKLTTAAMAAVEAQVTRLPALDKWFVAIPYVAGELRGA